MVDRASDHQPQGDARWHHAVPGEVEGPVVRPIHLGGGERGCAGTQARCRVLSGESQIIVKNL